MSQLNLKQIVPAQSRKGYEVKISEENKYLHVSYKTCSRNVSFTLPTSIDLDENFFEGLGLAIGDGLNNPSTRNTHFNFANTDMLLVNKMVEWLTKFNIQKIGAYLIVPLGTNKDVIDKISHELDKRVGKVNVYFKDRTLKPRVMIQVSNSIFQMVYLSLFSQLKSTILHNVSFRRSFLSGLFAAEGHVKHSVSGTLECMSFSFNPKTERELATFTSECLEREGIPSKIKIKEHYGAIYFTNYNNMLRFYLIGGISLSQGKTEKFVTLLRNAKIDVHLKNGFLEFLRTGQNKTAQKLGCSQANVSNMIKRSSISMQNAKKLNRLTEIRKLADVDYITISTCSIKDRKLIGFLLNF